MDRDVYLNKEYRAGENVINILSDLITACGIGVDRSILADRLVSHGLGRDDLCTVSAYNARSRPAVDQVGSIMDALGVTWSVRDGQFVAW